MTSTLLRELKCVYTIVSTMSFIINALVILFTVYFTDSYYRKQEIPLIYKFWSHILLVYIYVYILKDRLILWILFLHCYVCIVRDRLTVWILFLHSFSQMYNCYHCISMPDSKLSGCTSVQIGINHKGIQTAIG